MSYLLDIEIDGLPPMNSADGFHWRKRKRLRDEWVNRVWVLTINKRPRQPLASARIQITRFSSVEPDFDNLVQGGKWLMDGLTDCGIIEDDKPSVIGQPRYLWQKASPKQGRVRVEVWEGDG